MYYSQERIGEDMVDGVGMGNQEGHRKVEMVLLSSQRDKGRGYESRPDSREIMDTWLMNS